MKKIFNVGDTIKRFSGQHVVVTRTSYDDTGDQKVHFLSKTSEGEDWGYAMYYTLVTPAPSLNLNPSTPTIITTDVKVTVWNDGDEPDEDDDDFSYLAVIDPRSETPYNVWDDNQNGECNDYNYVNTTCHRHARLYIPPEDRKKSETAAAVEKIFTDLNLNGYTDVARTLITRLLDHFKEEQK